MFVVLGNEFQLINNFYRRFKLVFNYIYEIKILMIDFRINERLRFKMSLMFKFLCGRKIMVWILSLIQGYEN